MRRMILAGALVFFVAAACGSANDLSDTDLDTLVSKAAGGDSRAMAELEKRAQKTASELDKALEIDDPETAFQKALHSGQARAVEALSDAGNVYAQTHLAAAISLQSDITVADKSRGRALLERAVDAEHAPAIFRMSEDYRASSKLYPLDETKAFELGHKAAELGYVEAMYETGVRYQYGLLTAAKDESKAREWLEKAKLGGHARAQTQLDELDQEQN